MEIQNYKQIGKGCLKAKFDVMVPQWHMTIKDCALFEKEGREWITLPSKSYEGKDGGTKHFELVSFPKDVKERFQTKCLEMLKPMQPVKTMCSEEIPF
ncbi:MAG: hypothetical protein JSR46_04565 [Verrucomicrobia bacterium]|nr:hypothetical protein [Verrucomicrobiota bacterium]